MASTAVESKQHSQAPAEFEAAMILRDIGVAMHSDDHDETPSQKLRNLQNVSTVARWTVRASDLDAATQILQDWASDRERVLQIPGQLPDFRQELFEPTLEGCDCDVCPRKRSFQEAVARFHLLFRSYAAASTKHRQMQQQKLVAEKTKREQDELLTLVGHESELAAMDEELVAMDEELAVKYADLAAKNADLAAELAASKAREAAKDAELAASKAREAESAAREAESAAREAAKDAAAAAELAAAAAASVSKIVRSIQHHHVILHTNIINDARLANNTLASYNVSYLTPDSRIQEIQNAPSLAVDIFDDEPPKINVAPATEELRKFHACISKSFKKAVRIGPLMPRKKACFAETVWKIIYWKQSDAWLWPMYVPVARALEQEGCHPILGAIMYRIASMDQESDGDAEDFHQNSNHILHEHWFFVGRDVPTRRIDFALQKVEERLRAKLAYSCFVPIEVKPMERRHSTLLQLHEEGAHQVVGHLTKQIHHFFNLGGVGSDHVCYGAVLTQVSIEVFEIELSEMGTERVTRRVRRTQPQFLFDRETTEHLLGKRDILPNFEFNDVDNPLRGFELLAAVMRSPSDEGSPLPEEEIWYRDNINSPKRQLLDLLGTGGFCFVHKLDDESFVKIPRSPSNLPGLIREHEKLVLLRDWPFIPTAESLGTVSFRRGCEDSELPGLRLKGLVGMSASMHKRFSTEQLTVIFNNVRAALSFAHSLNIFHLDVRPSNIIVPNSHVTLRAQLGDWGASKFLGDEIRGFWGSYPFAHDEIYLKKSVWTPKAEYDFASLAFTMVALIDGKHEKVPWPEFHGGIVNKNMLDQRRRKSVEVISKSTLSKEVKNFLLKSLRSGSREKRKWGIRV